MEGVRGSIPLSSTLVMPPAVMPRQPSTRPSGPRRSRHAPVHTLRSALLVFLVATLTLVALAGPLTADAGWDEAVRRKLWDDADATAHWDELVHRVLWGWAPRTPAEDFVEVLRRAVWDQQDAVAHWDEAVRRYLFDHAQAPAPPTEAPPTMAPPATTKPAPTVPQAWKDMLTAAGPYQFHPGIWTISATNCTCDTPGTFVLGVADPWHVPGTVVLYPRAFTDQSRLNYVVAHESGHLWSGVNEIPDDVWNAITAISNPAPAFERFADCYAQKKGLARPQNVGYWDCPAPVLALMAP